MTKPLHQTSYTLIIAAGEGGTVIPAPGVYDVNSGVNINLSAMPFSGYVFQGWQGSINSSQPNIQVIMNQNMTLTATFIPDSGNGPGSGTTVVLPWLEFGLGALGLVLAYGRLSPNRGKKNNGKKEKDKRK